MIFYLQCYYIKNFNFGVDIVTFFLLFFLLCVFLASFAIIILLSNTSIIITKKEIKFNSYVKIWDKSRQTEELIIKIISNIHTLEILP